MLSLILAKSGPPGILHGLRPPLPFRFGLPPSASGFRPPLLLRLGFHPAASRAPGSALFFSARASTPSVPGSALFFSARASTPQHSGRRPPLLRSGFHPAASRAPPSSSPLGLPGTPGLSPPLLRSGFHPAASRAPPSFSPLGRPPRSVSGSALLSSARASTPQLLGPHLPPFLRTTLVDVLRPHSGAPGTFSHGVSGLAPPSS